jgi:hypothetical protein
VGSAMTVSVFPALRARRMAIRFELNKNSRQ